MTPEEKQQLERIIERHNQQLPSSATASEWRDIHFLLSIVERPETVLPPAEELTAASVLGQSLNTLKQIRELAASSRSYVPQDNAAEMMLRLEALGFGSQEPRRGNTLWAMVMDAADEIEQMRKTDVATSMRSRCVERVRERAREHRKIAAAIDYGKAVDFPVTSEQHLKLADELDSTAADLETLTLQEQEKQ